MIGSNEAKPFLLVHLIFHPASECARDTARALHRVLNDDAVVPGLRIPTTFCPVGDGVRPPPQLRLDMAQCNFIMPLADDEMSTDREWCEFIAEMILDCNELSDRCVPMQLTSNAWPLDDRLRGVNFGRAFSHPQGALRHEWVGRRTLIELCRFLQGLEATDDRSKAPIKIFLSHTKSDLAIEPRATERLLNYLLADQPVQAWVDSAQIETGARFSEAIQKGVEGSSMLVVLTDNYSSREWCREEVMLAKELNRPIALIDALMTHETRSFPFLDNVPRMRWNGLAADGVDLLLKETLRYLHARKSLESWKRQDDTVLLRPPEPAVLLGIPAGSNILYPDPPLGAGELRRLSKSLLNFSTPVERMAEGRPLDGKLLALSMSESSDVAKWGMDELHLHQAIIELSRQLLICGATLAYGGHVGSDSYAQRLFELVRTHNSREGAVLLHRIVMHRGWPLPTLNASQRAAAANESTIREIERPLDVDESLHPDCLARIVHQFDPEMSANHRYAWCRGMTEMRRFQSDRTKSNVAARIVLGGMFEPTLKAVGDGKRSNQWYSGRMPGVLEEILLSIQSGQPVFLIGAFGGTTKMIIDLLLGRGHPAAKWDVQAQAPFAKETRELYASRGESWWYYDDETVVNGLRTDESRSIACFLKDAWKPKCNSGWHTGINPLTEDENRELFTSFDTTRIMRLILKGLATL